MFDDPNFDFDDGDNATILHTSFTPVMSSTQISSPEKKHSREIDKENFKKPKLSDDEASNFSRCNFGSPTITETTVQSSVDTTHHRVVKRKFPGPAGLLPERTESNKSILEISAEGYKVDIPEMTFYSQETVSVFEDGPWKEIAKDFCVPNGECLHRMFNISWIKKQAPLKKLLVNYKVPFLAAIIQSLEILDGREPTVNVTLKDGTGDIQGTVLHSLYKQYREFFTIGSVLVLKQCGVLSAGYNNWLGNHCLIITHNNLMTIYWVDISKRLSNDRGTTISHASGHDVIKKIVIQRFIADEILKRYKEDLLINERKEKCTNFGNTSQNHGKLLRNSSDGGNRLQKNRNAIVNDGEHTIVSSKFTHTRKHQGNDFVVPKLRDHFNRSYSGSNTLRPPLEVLSKGISSDTSKKKFNFKSGGVQKLLDSSKILTDKSKDLNALADSQKVSFDYAHCDIVVSNSQSRISVRADNKEHSEIWKNLLEDVDTDSLFDEF